LLDGAAAAKMPLERGIGTQRSAGRRSRKTTVTQDERRRTETDHRGHQEAVGGGAGRKGRGEVAESLRVYIIPELSEAQLPSPAISLPLSQRVSKGSVRNVLRMETAHQTAHARDRPMGVPAGAPHRPDSFGPAPVSNSQSRRIGSDTLTFPMPSTAGADSPGTGRPRTCQRHHHLFPAGPGQR
jgi:hypothetical protein